MATMTRGNQKIQVQDYKISQFLDRGWELEKEQTTATLKPKKSQKRQPKIKSVEAEVVQQPVAEDTQEELDEFISDNFNTEEK